MKRRPTSLTIGTAVLALPFAIAFSSMFLTGQFHPSQILFLVFGFLPLSFALYRLLMGDKVARALVTVTALCAIGFSAFVAVQWFSYEAPEKLQELGAVEGASLSVVAASQMGEGAHRSGIVSSAFALCLSLGLIAVYVPQSSRWFREGSDDR
jgi:hypothetical protein